LSIIVQICAWCSDISAYQFTIDRRSVPGNYSWWAVQYGRFLPHDTMLSAVYAAVVCRQDLYWQARRAVPLQ